MYKPALYKKPKPIASDEDPSYDYHGFKMECLTDVARHFWRLWVSASFGEWGKLCLKAAERIGKHLTGGKDARKLASDLGKSKKLSHGQKVIVGLMLVRTHPQGATFWRKLSSVYPVVNTSSVVMIIGDDDDDY